MVFRDVERWFADRGDYTLRLDYDLNEDSIIWIFGGYHGDYVQDIFNKHKCNVYVFEPCISSYNILENRFSNDEKIRVFNYGISDKTGDVNFIDLGDASTIQNLHEDIHDRHVSVVSMKSFKDVYTELKLDTIDLLMMNVEGSEYAILNNIFENEYTEKIINYQIQFHTHVTGAQQMLEDIREELSKTHKQDWNYQWVWENWSLKS